MSQEHQARIHAASPYFFVHVFGKYEETREHHNEGKPTETIAEHVKFYPDSNMSSDRKSERQ